MKSKIYFVLILLLLLAGCSNNQSSTTDVAVAVALTQTAAAIVAPTEAAAVPQAEQQPEATAEAEQAVQAPAADAARIEFQSGATTWYTHGDLAAGASTRFVLAGFQGQQVTIWLTPDPAPDGTNLYAALNISGADGQSFSFSPEIYWSNVLPTTQDYFIDVTSLNQDLVNYQIVVEVSPTVIDPSLGTMYDLIPDTLCQELGSMASQALGLDFSVQTRAPFFDAVGGEAGQGCSLRAGGTGAQFNSPQEVVNSLVNSVGAGWNPQPLYQADGPTGSETGVSRDMALMLISANWQPAMGIVCPADQPISDCNLAPDQIVYTIKVDIAQYKASFSLDGEWYDSVSGLTLYLYQDWKSIYGGHLIVAQGGNKIDQRDVSINGMIQGQGAVVQFQSGFSENFGTAQITVIDANTIQWKIITPPEGENYLPADATLTR
jgi:hypothetical protein